MTQQEQIAVEAIIRNLENIKHKSGLITSYDIDTTHFFFAPPYGWEDYYETEEQIPQNMWEVSSDCNVIPTWEIEYYAPLNDIVPIID